MRYFFQAGNPRIWPICLPKQSVADKDHLKFRSTQVVGYGPSIDKQKQVLTILDLTINSISICNETYTVQRSHKDYFGIEESMPHKFNGGSVVCAGRYGSNAGTCRGDSGSPALFFDGHSNHQIAVVHGNIRDCDGSRFPSILVRLDNPEVLNWIRKVTAGTNFQSHRKEQIDSIS